MKSLWTALFFVLPMVANATSECELKYIDQAQKLSDWQDSKSAQWGGVALVLPSIILVPLAPVVGIPYFFLSGAATYKMLNINRAERALLLRDQAGKMYARLRTQAKKMKSGITDEELGRTIHLGFESGVFCSEDRLYSPRRIKKYVLKQVEDTQVAVAD